MKTGRNRSATWVERQRVAHHVALHLESSSNDYEKMKDVQMLMDTFRVNRLVSEILKKRQKRREDRIAGVEQQGAEETRRDFLVRTVALPAVYRFFKTMDYREPSGGRSFNVTEFGETTEASVTTERQKTWGRCWPKIKVNYELRFGLGWFFNVFLKGLVVHDGLLVLRILNDDVKAVAYQGPSNLMVFERYLVRNKEGEWKMKTRIPSRFSTATASSDCGTTAERTV